MALDFCFIKVKVQNLVFYPLLIGFVELGSYVESLHLEKVLLREKSLWVREADLILCSPHLYTHMAAVTAAAHSWMLYSACYCPARVFLHSIMRFTSGSFPTILFQLSQKTRHFPVWRHNHQPNVTSYIDTASWQLSGWLHLLVLNS